MNNLKMNFTKKFTMALMIFLFIVFCCAYAQSSTPSYTEYRTLRRINTPQKPKAPSKLFIEYQYNGNGFSFLPSVLFKFLEVTVIGVETGEVWGAVVSEASGYTMKTGPLSAGTYNRTVSRRASTSLNLAIMEK